MSISALYPQPRTPVLGVGGFPGSPPWGILSEGDGDHNVFRVIDGSLVNLTGYLENSTVESDEIVYPVLSPDESRVVYRMPRLSDGGEGLWGVSAGGGTPFEILNVAAGVGHRMMHPMWHPDSNQIVYSRGYQGAFGGDTIYLTDYAGSGPTALYSVSPIGGSNGYYIFRPQFNYDGSKIAFWVDKNLGTDATEGLYVMDADGSNVTQIKALTAPYRFAGAQFAWASTQDVLAYEYGNSVKTINADGTGETTISVGEIATNSQQVRISKYAWAADDTQVYVASRWFNGTSFVWRPYSCEPDGGGVVRLNDTYGPYDNAYTIGALFRWFSDDRLYMITKYTGVEATGTIVSMALDGTDAQTVWDGSGDYLKLYQGTGFEYV